MRGLHGSYVLQYAKTTLYTNSKVVGFFFYRGTNEPVHVRGRIHRKLLKTTGWSWKKVGIDLSLLRHGSNARRAVTSTSVCDQFCYVS